MTHSSQCEPRGGSGTRAAALLRFLTPERRVRAAVSEHVYTDLAANEAALVEAYGLHDARIYVPVQDAEIRDAEGDSPVRLFVPRHAEYEVPADELQSLLVASDVEQRRGLSLLPSGGRLFGEFESMLGNDLSDSPGELATQLADGITEGLELADRVTSDVRSAERRIDFGITDSVHGPVDRFDHPVQSFLAVGLAVGLDRPVVTETTTSRRPETASTAIPIVMTHSSQCEPRGGSGTRGGRTTLDHVRRNGASTVVIVRRRAHRNRSTD
ncbi:hypothetical protein BRC68_16330 [Halobacteriales archaeon QH_6_64_20]|nr:MAG: hypothetical protein BRC68_16330 [Halobacteriales archaeon QH_6_64_20]